MTRVLLLLLFVVLTAQAHAEPAITLSDASGSLTLVRSELEAFPQTVIETETPYFEGKVTFSGPSLRRVMEALGIEGHQYVTFRALNDYSVSGSVTSVLDLDAIVATRRNGAAMPVRQRGPFWIILPLTERPELDDPRYHRYMVWQLAAIELK